MGLIAGVSALQTFLWLIGRTVLSAWHPKFKFLDWVVSWHWQTWVALWSGVWIVVILKGTVAAVRRSEILIAAGVNDRKRLEEQLQESNTLLDSCKSTILQMESEISQIKGLKAQLESENQTLRAKQEVPLSFSVARQAVSPTSNVLTAHYEEEGQPKARSLRLPQRIVLTVKKHGSAIVEMTKLWVESPATSPAPDVGFPCHETVAEDPTTLDITNQILTLITKPQRPKTLRLEALRSLTTTFRISLEYTSGSSTARCDPQSYNVHTTVQQELLLIDISRITGTR